MTDYLKLFRPDGTEIPASRKELLQIEKQTFSTGFYQRILGDIPGTYWFISGRPGYVRMLLRISWHQGAVSREWSISFSLNGIASYAEWELGPVLRSYTTEEYGCTKIPVNVKQLARAHVYYVAGAKDSSSGPRSQFAIQILQHDKMSAKLAKIVPADTDTTLLTNLAGRAVEIAELDLAVVFFCQEQKLEGREREIMHAMVPFWRWLRLGRLQAIVNAQLTDS